MIIISYGFTLNQRKTDILIIGAGGAGARAAIEAARQGKQVVLTCRSPLGRGGLTPTARGGYHAAVLPGDSPAIHAEDLIAMGCCLNDRPLVYALTEEALPQARMLEQFGARINWEIPSKPHEPQMRHARSLFVPGKEVIAALRKEIQRHSAISLLEDYLAFRLLTRDGEVVGALLFNIAEGSVTVCESKATILATGSLGEIYPLTAQEPMGIPTGSTGSGYVLAGMAGADLVDMEMVQFAAVPTHPRLIQEMRFLPWAALRNGSGEEFLPPNLGEYSHEAAQAIFRELREGRGPVTLDLRGKNPPDRFRHPLVKQQSGFLRECGVTAHQRQVSIGVGALYMMGGVHINERCETSVPGLYAAGEVAASVHGARRVGGNAFPEMVVFGRRAGEYAAREAEKKKNIPEASNGQIQEGLECVSRIIAGNRGDIAPRELRERTRSLMGEHAHVIRNGQGLKTALAELEKMEKELPFVGIKAAAGLTYNLKLLEALDVNWLVTSARIVCQAALLREESRGFHCREDFPGESDAWLRHTSVRRVGEGWVGDSKPITGC